MLNQGQQTAFDAFNEFAAGDGTMFALFGAAGTGKSFTSGKMLDIIRPNSPVNLDEMLWLAPTWKAVRIAGKFLDQNGMAGSYEVGFDAYHHRVGKLILTTTQQALGIRPVISDEQTTDKVEFGRVGEGLIRRLKPRWIVIDEVSMLSWQHLKDLAHTARDYGVKILILGDPNQLPPVKAQEIKWDKIANAHRLTEIMRQASDSAIPHFGRAVLDEGDWNGMEGSGLRRTERAISAFIDEVGIPAVNEEERDVFVGYRNATVDRVQEAAAQKVYGHGATEFVPGEVVIAQSALHSRSGMVIANQDQLEVVSIDGQGEWGQQVRVRNIANGKVTYAEYLSGADMADKRHPYRIELNHRAKQAQALQEVWKKDRNNRNLNIQRKNAWAAFFALKDQTVLDFSHPFAITSHKSQGSSYRRTYIAAQELAQFSKRSLYVAATRPRQELVY